MNKGIYIHVPFCRSKCFYCNFYSVASFAEKQAYIQALRKEMALRKGYLPKGKINTLYFGGGTPSCLEAEDWDVIINDLEKTYAFFRDAERTVEMNPEDLTREKLTLLHSLGFNRVSVGVQSFVDERLQQIHRRHTGEEAIKGIELAAEIGFDNISVDLIAGLPHQSREEIQEDVRKVCQLPVQHVSVYLLSIEPGTVFEKRLQLGELEVWNDDEQADRFQWIREELRQNGFEHYEISNYARDEKYARHNTAYWQQQPYVGFGPSAHSYDTYSRQWNAANLKVYTESLAKGRLPFEREELSERDLYNEYVMTNLRTIWGVDTQVLNHRFRKFWIMTQPTWKRYIQSGHLVVQNHLIYMRENGWLISDAIFSDLFVV